MSRRHLGLVHTGSVPARHLNRLVWTIDTRTLDTLLAVYSAVFLGIGLLLGWALFS